MKKNEKLTLYIKIYNLTKYVYMMVKNFPKEYKYTLGQEICALSWECLDLLIEANSLPNNRKREKIASLSLSFDKLKMRLRLSQEVGIISSKQFAHIQENFLIEIGTMIGGFLKWAASQGGNG